MIIKQIDGGFGIFENLIVQNILQKKKNLKISFILKIPIKEKEWQNS